MSLAAEIEHHRDIVLRELDSVHDYYVVTKRAWRMVQGSVLRRGRFSVFNVVTGNRTTEQDLPQKAQNYIANYLAVATFQQAVSLLEDFVFGAMTSWMLAYPHRIARKQIPISVVFAAADLDAVKLAAIDREVNDIQYRNVRGWFAEFDEMVKLGCPSSDEIDRLSEIKASRDILVHNRGLANAIYEEKAGNHKRFVVGERINVPEPYHRQSWLLIRKVVTDMSVAALAKAH